MNKTYELITAAILAALDKGVVPWKKQWKSAGRPCNLISKRPYNGTNFFLLSWAPYNCPYWATYKQITEAGGQVRKGEKSTPIVFWGQFIKEQEDGTKKKILFPKSFRVFNAEQADGLKLPAEPEPLNFSPITQAEEIVTHMPNPPKIGIGGSSAHYVPTLDQVQMPKPEAFVTPEDYYSVLFHELSHATGHQSRLAREGIVKPTSFGTDPYAKEELIAEMSAAFLCAEVGIDQTLENSAAYIDNWRRRISDDPKLVMSAASAAQKAADYVLARNASTEN
jgi:antirestriction protein ArdC